ncbi:hypothetical protein GLOIN_2v1477305 [Rhizophagus irregularis DAOM 181602=DAOM 197198]|uniref:Specific transcriptional repressor n=1 Tax=Rhizophagus irregularis (strain DAOM 181602 / DAOM 197198 / MUCL 43194) TaxID=747089 RepID=A0A2P4Q5Q4_RHIID|nr:hypothetical protein GLOIN_2v1477305 [Rhizophagus irregularis DAOM 181602=DAOM 197198]POG72975.1 hypothetical protein GLOIN_2v1477305 [Rhizophagus irregularis DAOM 181602=DAOM 197198]|eukprot:XP_025179841.1 hypothetical protein GLOIN_2v1477305 [Rhizophagus irregularis DAOM 181602=DAOM 197198]
MSTGEISGIASNFWNEIPERESQFWTELSHITKEIHSIEYPNYKYSPVRSHNQNKSSKKIISQNTNLDTSVSKDSSEIVSHTTSEIDISPEIDINLSEIDIDMSEVDIDMHPTNFLYDRQVIDELSGFRNCTDYDYPIKLTELSFVPYPIVIGKWFFAKSTGINKVAIQQGATITSSFSYSGKTSIKKLDFCSVFRCPFVAGNFNETVLNILPSGPNDPVNTNFIFDTKFEVRSEAKDYILFVTVSQMPRCPPACPAVGFDSLAFNSSFLTKWLLKMIIT